MVPRTTKKTDEQIIIPKIELKQVEIRIVGTSPLVVHQFGVKAKRMMLEKQTKTAKTTAKEAKNPVEDFMTANYWLTPMPDEFTPDAFEAALQDGAKFGFKAVGVKAATVSAAYRCGLSKDKVSLFGAFHINVEFLEIKGVQPVMREDVVRLATGVADLRYRPEFPPGWYMDLPITYNSSLYSLEQIATFINLGGFAVGIGEYRIEKGGQWGAYSVATEKAA